MQLNRHGLLQYSDSVCYETSLSNQSYSKTTPLKDYTCVAQITISTMQTHVQSPPLSSTSDSRHAEQHEYFSLFVK
jgi:hypothetical protein